LKELPIPKDYTVEQVRIWLSSLRSSPDDRRTVEILVERINATKTEVNVISTLTSVLEKTGCGGRI
jgi:hypothetical protein